MGNYTHVHVVCAGCGVNRLEEAEWRRPTRSEAILGEAIGSPPRFASASFKAAGRVIGAIDNGAAVSYSFDSTNQLTADGSASYSYDVLGDRIERDEDADPEI